MKNKGKEKNSVSSVMVESSFMSVALIFEDEADEVMSLKRKNWKGAKLWKRFCGE